MIELSNAEYHARTDHVSKSMLDLINKAPAKLRTYLDGCRPEPTPAMLFGTAVHAAVLEPKKLICAPAFNRRTKAGKEEAEAFDAQYIGQDVVIVNADMHSDVMACREGVFRHKFARHIVDEGMPERSVFGEIDGVKVRCRPDWWRPSAGLIVDLKTTTDASPDGFAKSVWNFRYHVQDAFYRDVCLSAGHDVLAFVFVAVEKTPPYLCGVYMLDLEGSDSGREMYRNNLETYQRCMESGVWPGYSDKIELLKLPAWARRTTTTNEEF